MLWVCLVCWTLGGCGAASAPPIRAGEVGGPGPAASAAPGGDLKPLAAITHRKLIKDAKVVLRVGLVTEVSEQIRKATTGCGGFVANSALSDAAEGQRQASVDVKIPAESLDNFLTLLSHMGKVLSRTETAQDVTDEFYDVQARAKNLHNAEDRLREILKKSGALKDLLEVEKELTRVRGEIEKLEGHLQHLEQRVAYSTVSIQLLETQLPVLTEFWQVHETLSDAWLMFRVLTRLLLHGLIYLAAFLPFALVLWIVFKLSRPRRRKSEPGGSET